jgi:Zn-finger nucleic acid-binding protein
MRCPLDDTTLREVNRRGVQIDICPECKGVWLDRGELEKLMDAADQAEVEYERSSRSRGRDDDSDDDRRRGGYFGSSGDSFFGSSGDRSRRYEDERGRGYTQQKKKKSWFSQMMEGIGGED